jgi:hypothetical protein
VTRYDFTYLVASLAIETGIPHSEYLKMDRSLFLASLAYLKDRAKKVEDARRGKRNR